MEKALNELAATQDYSIVTKSSDKQCGGHYTVHYKCDLGGSYRNRIDLAMRLEHDRPRQYLSIVHSA